jgi:hypothetical protein
MMDEQEAIKMGEQLVKDACALALSFPGDKEYVISGRQLRTLCESIAIATEALLKVLAKS